LPQQWIICRRVCHKVLPQASASEIFLPWQCGRRESWGMQYTRGDHVTVTTADGSSVLMRALGPVRRGRDFLVLWVATEDEWDRAQHEDTEPDGLPWPAEAVTGLEHEHQPS
jgi:hypothetical protein